MKLVNVFIVLFLMIIMSPIQAKEVENVERITAVEDVIRGPSPTIRRDFTLGVSNAELARLAREQAEAEILARSNPTNSFTNYGNATLIRQDWTNNCVLWAKGQTGISSSIGYGGREGIQGQVAQVGAIAVEGGGYPHVGVVVAINGDQVTIRESNYYKGWITERTLQKGRIIGYVYT